MARTFNLYLTEEIVTTLKGFEITPLEAIKLGISAFADEKKLLNKEVAISYIGFLFSWLDRKEKQCDALQQIVLNNSETSNNDGRADTTQKE